MLENPRGLRKQSAGVLCVKIIFMLFYLVLSCLRMSSTSQFKMKHNVSRVVVVIGLLCFIRLIVLEDMPCLKISSYSVMPSLASVS